MEAARFPWPALGVLLVRDGLVSSEQLQRVLALQGDDRGRRVSSRRLGEALVENGLVTSAQVARLVAEQHELPFVDLESPDAADPVGGRIPEAVARQHTALPIRVFPDGSLLVVVADPTRGECFDEIRREAGVPIRFAVAAPDAIEAAIEAAAARGSFQAEAAEDLESEPHQEEQVPEDTVAPTAAPSYPAFGSLLLRDELVTESELDAALAQQRLSSTRRLGEILVARGSLTDAQVAQVLAEQHELPFVDLENHELEVSVGRRMDAELASRLGAVPISSFPDGSLLVAVADPSSALVSEELRAALDCPIRFVVAAPSAIDAAIDRVASTVHYLPEPDAPEQAHEPDAEVEPEPELEDERPVLVFDPMPLMLLPASEDEQVEDEEPILESEQALNEDSIEYEPVGEIAQPELELVDEVEGWPIPVLHALEAEDMSEPELEVAEPAPEDEVELASEAEVEEPVEYEPVGEVAHSELEIVAEVVDWPPVSHAAVDTEAPPEPEFEVSEPADEVEEPVEYEPVGEVAYSELEIVAETEVATEPELEVAAPAPEDEVEIVPELELEEPVVLEPVGDVTPPELEVVADVEEAPLPTLRALETETETEAEIEVTAPAPEHEVEVWFLDEVDFWAEEPEEVFTQDVEESQHDEIDVTAPSETVELARVLPASPVVAALERALDQEATAVHFTPTPDGILVRARVGGTLTDLETIQRADIEDAANELLELTAGGRVTVHEVELSSIALQTVSGTRATFRVVTNGPVTSPLQELVGDAVYAALADALERPGLFLVGGPAGSGRTTTLYAALGELAGSGAVLTIEDPVDWPVPGVDQTEVDPRGGVSYASGLHALLQADPDAVAVGELVDTETAHLVGRAALSQRVLTTVEATSAARTVRRVLDLGVAPAVLAESLSCVVAQRLLPRFCPDCREAYYATPEELVELGLGNEEGTRRLLGRSRGCDACDGTGQREPVAVFEVLPLDDSVRAAIAAGGTADEIADAAVAAGMQTLRGSAVRHCLEGVVTAAEALRVP